MRRSVPSALAKTRLAPPRRYVFCARNGVELDPPDDDAYELVIGVAAGASDDVGEIARTLATWVA